MKVHLRKKKLKDGSYSLLLDYFLSGRRVREYLDIHIKGNSQDSKEKIALAHTIAAQKETELVRLSHGGEPLHKKLTDFFLFFSKCIKASNRKSKRSMNRSMEYLKEFSGVKSLPSNLITPDFCQKFRNFLGKKLSGETPHIYFSVFKQVLRSACNEHIFFRSPADSVKNPKPGNVLRKEVLTASEILTLRDTPLGHTVVKQAFLFACFTGLRMVDVGSILWKDIDPGHRMVRILQSKTSQVVFIPLSRSAMSLLPDPGKRGDKVFPLPSNVTVLKSLKTWTVKAGIKKHITFHCARHSYASLLLTHGNDLKTTSLLLGHTTTRETEKYTHISDKMKRKAVDSLPELV